MKKMTYADVASEITSKQKKYQGIIDSQDTTNLEKKTAQMNLQQLNKFADEVFQSMEADKKESVAIPQQSFAYGGAVDPRLLGWVPGQPMPMEMRQAMLETMPVDPNMASKGDLSGLYDVNTQMAPRLPYAPDRSPQPLKTTSSAQLQTMNESIQDPGNGIDPSSVAGYIIPGMNMARGIFGKTKELDHNDYKITKKVSPLRMDVSSQLEGIDSQAATTRRNIRSGSPTQIMSGNIATSDWATRAKAGIYGNKWNVDQQSRQQSQLLDIENEKNNIQTELMIGDLNDRAKAAKEGILNTGMSQMLESYYRDRNDATIQRQLEQDQSQFEESARQTGAMSDKYLANAKETSERNYNLELQRMANELGDSKLARESAERIAKMQMSGGGGGYNLRDYEGAVKPYDAGKLVQIALNYVPGADMTTEERRIVETMRKDKRIMTDWMLHSLPNKPKDEGTLESAKDYLWNDFQRYGQDGGKAAAAYVIGRDKFDKILNEKGTEWRRDPLVQKALHKIDAAMSPSLPGTTMKEVVIRPDRGKLGDTKVGSTIRDFFVNDLGLPETQPKEFTDPKGNVHVYDNSGEMPGYRIVSGPDFKERNVNGKIIDFLEATAKSGMPGKVPIKGLVKTNPKYPNLTHMGTYEVSGAELLGGAFKKVGELPVKGIKEGTAAVVKGVKYIFKNGQWSEFMKGVKK